MKNMSKQMTDMRKDMEKDKQIGVLMAGLRGSNMDESDFADDSVVMQLVEVAHDDTDQLPLAYNPERIADFWGRRPVAVIRRALQLLGKQDSVSSLHISQSSNPVSSVTRPDLRQTFYLSVISMICELSLRWLASLVSCTTIAFQGASATSIYATPVSNDLQALGGVSWLDWGGT